MPKEYFDREAATWDNIPQRLNLAKTVAEEIINSVPLLRIWTALDYGCGTGSLSFFLKSSLNSITLADESKGMLDVLENKIKAHNVINLHPIKLNLLEEKYTAKHDLIYTLMALHHIKDVHGIIAKFYSILNKDGYLCIGDLVEEDGSFHAHHTNYDGHNGFNLNSLKDILQKSGFKEIKTKICFEMEKEINLKTCKYPVFLMTAKK